MYIVVTISFREPPVRPAHAYLQHETQEGRSRKEECREPQRGGDDRQDYRIQPQGRDEHQPAKAEAPGGIQIRLQEELPVIGTGAVPVS